MDSQIISSTSRDHLTWKFILIKNSCHQHLHVLYSRLTKVKINHPAKYLNYHHKCAVVSFYSYLITTMVTKWRKRASLSTPYTNGTIQICTDSWSISISTRPKINTILSSMVFSIKDSESTPKVVRGLIPGSTSLCLPLMSLEKHRITYSTLMRWFTLHTCLKSK